jgi:hypothetical protein
VEKPRGIARPGGFERDAVFGKFKIEIGGLHEGLGPDDQGRAERTQAREFSGGAIAPSSPALPPT